ncbi:MAG: hypothetical protein D8M28_00730 [Proteobacteria bacterium]|nr:hypothetical protein [Pseudomonadota bacterium]
MKNTAIYTILSLSVVFILTLNNAMVGDLCQRANGLAIDFFWAIVLFASIYSIYHLWKTKKHTLEFVARCLIFLFCFTFFASGIFYACR